MEFWLLFGSYFVTMRKADLKTKLMYGEQQNREDHTKKMELDFLEM